MMLRGEVFDPLSSDAKGTVSPRTPVYEVHLK